MRRQEMEIHKAFFTAVTSRRLISATGNSEDTPSPPSDHYALLRTGQSKIVLFCSVLIVVNQGRWTGQQNGLRRRLGQKTQPNDVDWLESVRTDSTEAQCVSTANYYCNLNDFYCHRVRTSWSSSEQVAQPRTSLTPRQGRNRRLRVDRFRHGGTLRIY